MKRTRQNKTPSAILCSDFHLREDTPICFTGDFQKEQWDAVEFVQHLQTQYKCPIFHAGDLFHHWKPSPSLISQALWFLPEDFNTIYGQHDLPQHNMELKNKSGLNTLAVAARLWVLKNCHFGQEPYEPSMTIKNKTILVWHHLTYIKKPFPEAKEGNAKAILRKYPQFDLIVTGDNHTSFTVEYQGRRLVNPGNLTRQSAAQIDYQPRIALWYTEDNSIKWINLPMQKNVISREHIKDKEERNERIEAFIKKLTDDWEAELSFEDNLEIFFKQDKTPDSIRQIIYKIIEDEK